jgi:hypothetical protein
MSIRWTRQVACIGEKRKLKKCLERGTFEKRGDNIKVKLSEMACENAKWNYLSHDSVRWRVVGRTVMC